MSKSKIAYNITFGLNIYFLRELNKLLEEFHDIIAGFDESRNKIKKKEQMDVTPL